MGPTGSAKMFVLLPMLFLMKQVDFENVMIMTCARIAFFTCQILQILIALYTQRKINTENNTTKIYVPAPAPAFGAAASTNEYEETTYFEFEKKKIQEFLQQSIIGAVISSFVHFKFGVQQVVIIQSVMIPLNIYENVLIKTHLFGRKDKRVWDEKLQGEDRNVVAAVDDAKVVPEDPREAIVHTWDEAGEGDFETLWKRVKTAVDTQTSEDEWSALMIACGSPVDTTTFLEKMITADVDVMAQDTDGWTALHWSAFHGRPSSANTLLSLLPETVGKVLLEMKDKNGKTAQDVAHDEGNTEVVSVLTDDAWSVIDAGEVLEATSMRKRKGEDAKDITNVD